MTRIVLVTGCRSGFGLQTAKLAAERGWTVYAGLRDLATDANLRAATEGLDVRPLQLDITVNGDRVAAVDRIRAEVGRLDALVNNAGRGLGGFLELVEEDEMRDLFEVNVIGGWAVTKQALPLMRESGGTHIVQVSSTSGLTAIPMLGAYAGTKFAVEGMGEAWRHELALFGIRFALVEPGAYATDIFGRNQRLCRRASDPGPYEPWAAGAQEIFDDAVKKIARDPREVAEKILEILDDPDPSFRNPIGPSSTVRRIVKRAVPFGIIEAVMRKALDRARKG